MTRSSLPVALAAAGCCLVPLASGLPVGLATRPRRVDLQGQGVVQTVSVVQQVEQQADLQADLQAEQSMSVVQGDALQLQDMQLGSLSALDGVERRNTSNHDMCTVLGDRASCDDPRLLSCCTHLKPKSFLTEPGEVPMCLTDIYYDAHCLGGCENITGVLMQQMSDDLNAMVAKGPIYAYEDKSFFFTQLKYDTPEWRAARKARMDIPVAGRISPEQEYQQRYVAEITRNAADAEDNRIRQEEQSRLVPPQSLPEEILEALKSTQYDWRAYMTNAGVKEEAKKALDLKRGEWLTECTRKVHEVEEGRFGKCDFLTPGAIGYDKRLNLVIDGDSPNMCWGAFMDVCDLDTSYTVSLLDKFLDMNVYPFSWMTKTDMLVNKFNPACFMDLEVPDETSELKSVFMFMDYDEPSSCYTEKTLLSRRQGLNPNVETKAIHVDYLQEVNRLYSTFEAENKTGPCPLLRREFLELVRMSNEAYHTQGAFVDGIFFTQYSKGNWEAAKASKAFQDFYGDGNGGLKGVVAKERARQLHWESAIENILLFTKAVNNAIENEFPNKVYKGVMFNARFLHRAFCSCAQYYLGAKNDCTRWNTYMTDGCSRAIGGDQKCVRLEYQVNHDMVDMLHKCLDRPPPLKEEMAKAILEEAAEEAANATTAATTNMTVVGR